MAQFSHASDDDHFSVQTTNVLSSQAIGSFKLWGITQEVVVGAVAALEHALSTANVRAIRSSIT